MEREPLPHLTPEDNRLERAFEPRESSEKERARKEVAELFDGKLHREVINQLFDSGYSWIHERFAVLIEFGKATENDEKAYIEARNGWKEDSALRDKWDAELIKISLERHGGRA